MCIFRNVGMHNNKNWRPMVDLKRNVQQLKPAATAAVAVLLTACGSTGDWIKDRISTTNDNAPPEILGAPSLDSYVDELSQIASGDPAAQAEVYADAAAAAQLTPSPSTNLRLGLVLAIPGHPESDPERAVSLLRDVLTQTELLTEAEISLAQILLNSAERQVVAAAETRRLRASNTRAQQTQEQALAARLARVEAENRQLRRELDDAQQKLDALRLIERSIRERE